MQIVLFTLVAIALYLFTDFLLRYIERRRGKVFANRSLLFFVIILALSMVTFEVLQAFLQNASQS